MQRIFRRALLTTALAAMAVTVMAGSAAASRSLSLAPGGAFSIASQGLISFSMPNGIGGRIDLHCATTLSGALSRAIAKRSGTGFAQITGAVFGPMAENRCNDAFGQVTTATPSGLPWNISYSTFTGSLPRLTLVQFLIRGVIINLSVVTILPPGGCTFSGDVPMSLGFSGAAPNVSGLIKPLRHTMPLISGSIGGSPTCFRSAEFVGAFDLIPRQTLILIN
jgi:hypothetical protein